VTAIVCVVFGLAPAAAARPVHLRGAPIRRRVAPILVAAEVTLSILLLVGAGLLLKSFARLSSVDAGFNPDHLLTMQIQRRPRAEPTAHATPRFSPKYRSDSSRSQA
jgi:hypothetical protein